MTSKKTGLLFLPLGFLAGAADYKTIPAIPTSEMTRSLSGASSGPQTSWYRSHGNSAGMRYSSLKQIDIGNVSKLQVAWIYRSGDGKANIQCNPVIANGVMYAPTAGNHLVALDATNGKELWRFSPEGQPAFRGLIYWPGQGTNSRLFFSAGDWLYSLDAKTGTAAPGFGRLGRVQARSTVAPVIYKNVVVLPCWNEVRAFDILTGAALWTFHSVPQQGEYGHETWPEPGYGANTWGGIVLDEPRGIAYFSTGSPHPNYLGMKYPGENLFANCVVALNAETGKYLWHFQEIRHDIWDLDIPAAPNLVTVTREGIRYDAVAQVTKVGNTLILDRITGRPLFPFRLRRAPASTLEDEKTAEWQPDVELPERFAPQEFSIQDVTDISPESHAYVMRKIAGATFGWFKPFEAGKPLVYYGMHGGAEWTGAAFDPSSSWLYVSANKLPWMVSISKGQLPPKRIAPWTPGNKAYLQFCAGCHGAERNGGMGNQLFTVPGRLKDAAVERIVRNGHGSMPAIPVPQDELAPLLDFLFERDLSQATLDKTASPAHEYKFEGYSKLLDQDGRTGVKPPWGTLNAIDLNTGRIAWRVPLGEDEELTKRGLPLTGTENFGGPSVTAGGLVFCAGTKDLKIRAFDSKSGVELWQYRLPFGGFAPPAIYEVNGREYVVISATGGGKLGGQLGDAYVAFSLPPGL
jgi:quinoprotein glucose dehydrogenase